MTGKRTILLGLFFLAALGVLAYYTLFLTDFTLFREKAQIDVRFSETNGLREGDAVLVAGMRWGRVQKLTFDPRAPLERRILVVATLDEPLVLREGFTISIEDATLLGGKNLAIDPGPADGAEVSADAELRGRVAPNPLDALGDLVKKSSEGVERIVDDLGVISGQIREGRGTVGRILNDESMAESLAAALDRAAATLANMQQISADLAQGRGTVGKLLETDELHGELLATTQELKALATETTRLVREISSGEGVLGRLFSDRELADRLVRTVDQVGEIVARVNRGEGTIGRLSTDDTLARNLETITTGIAEGRGTVGALLTRPELFDNVLSASEDIAAVTGSIRSGQGTLGRLAMDPEVYNQLKSALQVAQRSLEEYREAAPITTFTSVFFAAW